MAAIKLEKIREDSLKIKLMEHVYSEQHKEITEKAFILMEGESTYINMDSAITKYVSRGTELESYTEAQLSSYTSEDIDFKLNRLFNYMIESPKGTLTQAIGQSRLFFYEELFNEINRLKKISTLIIYLVPACTLIILLLFIPYILFVQSKIYPIYIHLGKIKNADIKYWLEICNKSSSEMKASITEIKKIYTKESFDVPIIKENLKEEEQYDRTTTNEIKQNTEDVLMKNNLEELDEEENLISNEEMILKRKQEIFSNMSKKKTQIYLIVLLLLALFLIIYRIIDGSYSSEIQNTGKKLFNVNEAFSNRNLRTLFALYYFREEMRLGEVSFLSNIPAVPYLLSLCDEQEEAITKLRSRLTGRLQPIMDLMSIADSSRFCSELLADDSSCSTIYSGILKIGYKGTILSTLTYMKKLHAQFSLLSTVQRTSLGLQQFTNQNLVEIEDVRSNYEAKAFDTIFSTLFDIEEDWNKSMKTLLIYKFSSFLILFLVLFSILWIKMINNMRYDIMKVLGILNILPTIYLRENAEFLKSISKSSLIH